MTTRCWGVRGCFLLFLWGVYFGQVAMGASGVDPFTKVPTANLLASTPGGSLADSGALISLDFKDTPVKAVLEVLGDFSHSNFLISETVVGNISLHIHQIPWVQVLDALLQAKGLGKSSMGGVMYIAPISEIVDQEKLSLLRQEREAALAPLKVALLPIKYANAEDLSKLLQQKDQNWLSSRGVISVDQRTNTLLVQDVPQQLPIIQNLVEQLDFPVSQIEIDAKIVMLNTSAQRDLGVVLKSVGSGQIAEIAGREVSVRKMEIHNGVNNPTGDIGLSIGSLPAGFALDLELEALESEGQSKTIASPRLIVANRQEAHIEQGQEAPFQAATSSGATQVEFKKAVLGLTVTPQITPDHRVLMKLEVSDDHFISRKGIADIPIISTARVSSFVWVGSGETLVLGGIVRRSEDNSVTRVPFLGTIPMLGWLFSGKAHRAEDSELMVFITPKILEVFAKKISTSS